MQTDKISNSDDKPLVMLDVFDICKYYPQMKLLFIVMEHAVIHIIGTLIGITCDLQIFFFVFVPKTMAQTKNLVLNTFHSFV